MKSIFSPNVQENKVSSPKIQTQHIIKQHASACVQSHFSRVRLLATPWTIAHQAPLSTGFSRQEITGVGYHALLWGIFLTQGSNPHLLSLLCWQGVFFTTAPPVCGGRVSSLISWRLSSLFKNRQIAVHGFCCYSFAESCPTLCHPMGCSSQAPLSCPVSRCLLKFTFMSRRCCPTTSSSAPGRMKCTIWSSC